MTDEGAKWGTPEHIEYANKRMVEMEQKTGLKWNVDPAASGVRFRSFPGVFHLAIYERGDWFLDKAGEQIESRIVVEGDGNFDVGLSNLMDAYRRNMEEPTKIPEVLCGTQKRVTMEVVHEFERTARRLERNKTFPVFQLSVFAFNCDNKVHGNPDTLHIDYAAEPGRMDIPGALQAVITATETLLKTLKAKVQ